MYKIYLAGVLFPVAPKEIETKINGMNKTLNLINQAEINVIKGNRLTDYSFDLLLPNSKYPFAQYDKAAGFQNSTYFLNKLQTLKNQKKPFEMIILKANGNAGSDVFQNIVQQVTLENYTIKDNADDGTDITVLLELKSYVNYGVTKLKVKKSTSKVTYTKIKLSTKKKKLPTSYTTKNGDNLHLIAKKVYGKYTENNCKAIIKANNSTVFNSFILVFLSNLRGKTVKKVPSDFPKRMYTKMTFTKGIKLTIPQNK